MPQPNISPKTTASLEVPSEFRYLRTLRLTTASLLASWDLDVELIEDLRVAVSEACALLWERHGRSGTVWVGYHLYDGSVRIELQLRIDPRAPGSPAPSGAAIATDTISETLIANLTDRHYYQPENRQIVLEVLH